jgi:F1F0 ATPase subunit 2
MNYLLLFIAGIAIGTVFFATLRWQVRLLLEKKTMLKFSLITLARFGFLIGTICLLLKYGGWQGGILALAGIITVRFLMVQRSKKIEELRNLGI